MKYMRLELKTAERYPWLFETHNTSLTIAANILNTLDMDSEEFNPLLHMDFWFDLNDDDKKFRWYLNALSILMAEALRYREDEFRFKLL